MPATDPLFVLALVLAFLLLTVLGVLALRPLGAVQSELIRTRTQYNDDLKRFGALEIEIAQLRIELERQHEIINHLMRDAQARDLHINELRAGIQLLPTPEQRIAISRLTTPAPPPLNRAPLAAPRHIPAPAIQALAAILTLPWLASRDQRDVYLLAGLPPKFTGKITRRDEATADLTAILTMAFGFGPDTFRMVLQNAVVALNGSDPGKALTTWCDEWGFQPVVTPAP